MTYFTKWPLISFFLISFSCSPKIHSAVTIESAKAINPKDPLGLFSTPTNLYHIDLLLGKDDAYIIKYFNFLNSLRPNPAYKIKHDMSKDGNMILSISFSLKDESYFGCNTLMTFFRRSKNGTEMCVEQIIGGDVNYGQENVNFLKDNFTQNGDHWEAAYSQDLPNVIIEGEFKKIGDTTDYPMYMITYSLREKPLK